MKTFSLLIANFKIDIVADDSVKGFPTNYKPFMYDGEGETLLTYEVTASETDDTDYTGELMGSFSDLGYRQDVIGRPEGGYVFRIYDTNEQLAATMASDAQFKNNKVRLHSEDITSKTFGINNTLMIAFAFSSAYHSTLMMHSSVIKKDGRGYMFLGKSGTGKSTHSSLWLKHIEGTELLNDDNPILRIIDGKAIVFGTPWSGKTPCYKQDYAPVGGIVMLEQKPFNHIDKENVVTALTSMLCSCSIMIWDKPSYNALMNTISNIITLVGIHHLGCLPDKAAAELSYRTLSAQDA